MDKTRLGRTNLMVTRTAFGALPIQRVDFDTARAILRRAVEAGINFIDTARAYSDSEEKIGHSLADVRDELVIATKTTADTKSGVLEHLHTSLTNLKTDHVDILQFHCPRDLPDPDNAESSYAGALEARRRGMTRFIGLTAHRLDNAIRGARSGLYDTVQFPLSAISSPADLELIDICRTHDVGLIGMKALCGGLLSDIRAAFAFLRQYDNVVPIWGIQRMAELEEILGLDAQPPAMNDAMWQHIERDRRQLGEHFCRACGYCLPCPAGIPIPMAARMGFLLRRAPTAGFLSENWQQQMRRIEQCTRCGLCRSRCPYKLDPPSMLAKMLADYDRVLAAGEPQGPVEL